MKSVDTKKSKTAFFMNKNSKEIRLQRMSPIHSHRKLLSVIVLEKKIYSNKPALNLKFSIKMMSSLDFIIKPKSQKNYCKNMDKLFKLIQHLI